jgi:hypothetical protein
MQRGSSSTHLKVSRETRALLKKVRKDIDAKSIDAVVNWLLDKHLDQGDADGAAGLEEEEADGPQQKRKLNVRDPLYSLEILSEREGMLEYLTGFDRSEVNLLVKRFGEVRMSFSFFQLDIACPCATFVFVVLMSSGR